MRKPTRETILLGAGASKEAGIPGSFGMTERLREELAAEPWSRAALKVCDSVIGGLFFQRADRKSVV